MLSKRGLVLLIAVAFLTTGAAPQQQEGLVRRLVQEDLFAWYQSQTDAKLDSTYAGAYVMLAVGGELFIGMSASVPTHDHNGPLFAAHDGETLRLIALLKEQDVNRMRAVGDALFIPGYDPNDGWDAGNLYRYDTQTGVLTKLRYRYNEPHFVDATTTDANGNYSFSGLKPTAYIVRFILPSGYEFTTRQAGYDYLSDSNPALDSGVEYICSSGKNMPFQGLGASAELTIDAGAVLSFKEVPLGEAGSSDSAELQPDASFYSGEMTIGDFVWIDSNGDGLQGGNEPGLEGVRVELYTRDPYFPCVIHASGFWSDAETGRLYYNGGVIYSNITFVSDDLGETWRIFSQEAGHYWARDFVFFNGYFYKTHREIRYPTEGYNYAIETEVLLSRDGVQWSPLEVPGPAGVQSTASDGTAFSILEMTIDDTNALVEFQGKLIVFKAQGDALYAISEAGDYETFPVSGADLSGILPGFHEPDFPPGLPNDVTGASNRHNTLANANDELLYAIGGDNVLYATPDLRQWYPVADFNTVDDGAPLISLTFWGERQWLVAATAGETGSLYYLPHGDVIARIQP